MIVGKPNNMVMIQLDQTYIEGFLNDEIPSGVFNFIIDGKFYPGEGLMQELWHIVESLKDLYCMGIKKIQYDLGNRPLSSIDFEWEDDNEWRERPKYLIDLSADFLYDYGFGSYLGFDGDEERFIFTNDHFITVDEIRLPKGTIGELINSLPSAEDLKVLHIGNCQITTLKGH